MDAGSKLSLSDLANLMPDFLGLTMDQLRTLVLLQKTGSPREAGALLARQQSSIQSQITTLNKYLQNLCGQELAVKRGRGETYAFTPTGIAAASWAESIISFLAEEIKKQKQALGAELIIATTAFSLPLGKLVYDEIRDQFPVKDMKINFVQIRTAEFLSTLRDNGAGLVIGGVVMKKETQPVSFDITVPIDEDIVMIPWRYDTPAVLVSADNGNMHGKIDERTLATEKLIVPTSGILAELFEKVYGAGWQKKLNVEWPITDIYYGINLLKSGLADGALVVLRSVGDWIVETGGTPPELASDISPTARTAGPITLKCLPLSGAFSDFVFVTGLFARVESIKQLASSHPLQLYWQAFERHARLNLDRQI